jgi:hypothetical protein
MHPKSNPPPSQGDWRWNLIASTIKVKVKGSRDPFDDAGECKIGDEHEETIVQLAKNGRNLLLGNSSCFVFVFGVYGHWARFYRFDCSGVIVSKAFNYAISLCLLGEFFWRFVHPKHSHAGVVGSDPTVTRPTEEEALGSCSKTFKKIYTMYLNSLSRNFENIIHCLNLT